MQHTTVFYKIFPLLKVSGWNDLTDRPSTSKGVIRAHLVQDERKEMKSIKGDKTTVKNTQLLWNIRWIGEKEIHISLDKVSNSELKNPWNFHSLSFDLSQPCLTKRPNKLPFPYDKLDNSELQKYAMKYHDELWWNRKIEFQASFSSQVLSIWTRPCLGLESSSRAGELARVDLDFFPTKGRGVTGKSKEKSEEREL